MVRDAEAVEVARASNGRRHARSDRSPSTFAVLLFLLIAALPAVAQKRYALVIGVSDYGAENQLPNAVSDAVLIAKVLKNVGFAADDVRLLDNPTKGKLRDALDELYSKAHSSFGALVMIYFAGHAVQFEGTNYLLPKGTDLVGRPTTPGDYDDQGFNAQLLINKFSRSRVHHLLVVLDACRDNPFGGSPGLSELSGTDTGPNWMIAFSASAGKTASDGKGVNSPYAMALAEELQTPDATLTQVFERVNVQFANDRSLAHQRPYAKGSISIMLRQSAMSLGDIQSIGSTISRSDSGRGYLRGVNDPQRDVSEIAKLVGQDRIAGGDDGRDLLRDALARRPLQAIKDAADAGDGFSLYLMGMATWYGIGGATKNVRNAVSYMRLALAHGVGRAASSLGFYFCCDEAGPKNDAEAVEWFRVGDALNAPSATRNLALSYRDGTGVPKDLAEAVRLLVKAGQKGSSQAWANLGSIYAQKRYGMFDPANARRYFQKAADLGNFNAVEALADDYRYGLLEDGSDKNPRKAVEIYLKATRAGCIKCWKEIGDIYSSDAFDPPDLVAAFAAYWKGSDAGDPESMIEAGEALKNGRGTELSKSAAYAQFLRAYEIGHPEGKGRVGGALAQGEGVARDPLRAAALLRETLALDRSTDKATRHSVYAPNYWVYAHKLSALLADGSVPPATPGELEDLRARYGSEAARNMKRFTVQIACRDRKFPFDVYLIDWNRSNEETPIDSQVEWLLERRGCTISQEVIILFAKLNKIARENNVSFVDLTAYAVGDRAKSDKPASE
jgi:hypothetical protein